MTKLYWLCRYSVLMIIAFGAGATETAFGQEKPAEPAFKTLRAASLLRCPTRL
jgi:hypothetical protein